MTDSIKDTSTWSRAKRELLEKRLSRKPMSKATIQAITCRNNNGAGIPLSFAQERLWFQEQFEPGSPRYNMAAAAAFNGSLDISALEHSLSRILARHEALRTTFDTLDGLPVQLIHNPSPMPIPLTDLSALDQPAREAALRHHSKAEAHEPFDLKAGPLVRARLLRLGVSEHVLLVTLHHIVADGWSIGVLIAELSELYQAAVEGRAASLPELEIQYADYAVWQREWLSGQVLEEQVGYWRRQLAGAPPILEMPTDRARPAVQSYRGGSERLEIGEAEAEAVRELSRGEGATLFMVMMAAFQVLLMRYSGQDDVVVGTPIANRRRKELEGLIGFFVNTLVMRVWMGGEPSFREVVRRVKEAALGAYTHQDVPFEKLVEEMQPERDLSYTPLFQVMFIMQNAPVTAFCLPGLELTLSETDREVANLDIVFSIKEVGARMEGVLEYSTDLFDAITIKRLLDHFNNLLRAVAADPGARVSEINFLTEAEQHQILVEWDRAHINAQPGECVQSLFEKQVESIPDAPAVTFKGKAHTYSEINSQSNRIAHGLGALGLPLNEPIAVMLDSNPTMISVLLAILKAGGFFTCLNPSYPMARLMQIMEDAQPPCLITDAAWLKHHQSLVDQYRRTPGGRIVVVDLRRNEAEEPGLEDSFYGYDYFGGFPDENPDNAAHPEDPVYVVYTSGSTGRPKGIVQSHRSLVQFLQWQSNQFAISLAKRISQWSSVSYDASYCEIFGALCFGATLCLADAATKSNPASVVEWIEKDQLTLFQTVPSFCDQMLTTVESYEARNKPDPLAGLETMMLAGEVLPVKMARTWLNRYPNGPKLYNLYGPTECILATYHPVENVKDDQRSVPIGRAISGRQILIFDKKRGLCPVGVKGEVVVRSRYLTMGYFRRPEETLRVYRQNPLHNDFEDRVYFVGDLARWLPDGRIEFFGRADNQVKIRGMRVELEDIECVLSTHPLVSQCAVVAHTFKGVGQALVAYVVAKQQVDGKGGQVTDMHFTAEESCKQIIPKLLSFLKEHLPQHMVPSTFIPVASLPRTPNGKVNRSALPKPDKHRADPAATYVAPRSDTEMGVAHIWRDLLKIEEVGVNDSFFESGGHSLLATQMVNKIKDTYCVELPLRSLFETPTIAELSLKIDAAHNSAKGDAEKIAELMKKVKQLSADEVKSLLREKRLSSQRNGR